MRVTNFGFFSNPKVNFSSSSCSYRQIDLKLWKITPNIYNKFTNHIPHRHTVFELKIKK
jgi:hypothetical protein